MLKYLSIFLFFIIISCATYSDNTQLDKLRVITFEYENSIRWGDYIKANNFRERKGSNKPDMEKLGKIKVSNYEVIDKAVSEDKMTVTQVVEIKYYNINSLVEKTYIDNQIWQYNKDKKAWLLKSGLPKFE